MIRNAANVLTLLRVVAVPCTIYLLHEEPSSVALLVFLAAGLTDTLDGWVAKRFGQQTQLGAIRLSL